jgi:hypothetical protein
VQLRLPCVTQDTHDACRSQYTYGTSLFVSEPAPALASKPYGYGAYGSAGLFSNHDQTAKCVLNSMCTAAQCSTGECNGAFPLLCLPAFAPDTH